MTEPADRIGINFLLFAPQSFSFALYRALAHPDSEAEKLPGEFESKLPLSGAKDEEWPRFRILFTPQYGFEEYTCESYLNPSLTIRFLESVLQRQCISKLLKDQYILPSDGFRRRIHFVLQQHPEGTETVWIEPYFLRDSREFGVLVDFKFRKSESTPFNRKVQQLSLSLDKQFRSNRQFYSDRLEKVKATIGAVFQKLFPIAINGNELRIEHNLKRLPVQVLRSRELVFANGLIGNSPYAGLKQHGPFSMPKQPLLFFFVYQEANHELARDLYRALRGEKYATVFAGMDSIFRVPDDSATVKGISVGDFTPDEVTKVISQVQADIEHEGRMPAVFALISKESEHYFTTKRLFLAASIPLQIVRPVTLATKDMLKWSIGNIALQVFAKSGGVPWKVRPETAECLIIGIGQTYDLHESDSGPVIKRFTAYSILTDSSGAFYDIALIADSDAENTYSTQFAANLKSKIQGFVSQKASVVIHTPFKLRKSEMDAVRTVIAEFADIPFVVVKVNTENKFFGYQFSHNSLVPYESSLVALSEKEYLVWFEGLNPKNPSAFKRFSGPTHVEFLYPNVGELRKLKRDSFIQDLVNLGGVNWRGFNARTLPVSTYYCELVARFLKGFEGSNMPLGDVLNDSRPWFL